eukprot:TRINITY_DN1446_c0_g1_i1.p1 TRINITY_DN1446_c0_g1~~TRINITY_DN1446_c0_g1_i1.p1  ORF type:complete len:342 (-),score=56.47 TRINITY_DN1446_c0_g1_i1:49-1074(-)
MYIGPWQEYKLAKLIQARPEIAAELGTPAASRSSPASSSSATLGRLPSSGLPRQRSIDRLHNPGCPTDCLETASVASSTRSGLSSSSAPPRLSAQSRLDDMFQGVKRGIDRGDRTPSSSAGRSSSSAGRRPPRPRLSGAATATGRPPAAGRGKAKAAAKPSPEEERRARIASMQRLYGLAGREEALDDAAVAGNTAVATASAGLPQLAPGSGTAALPSAFPPAAAHEGASVSRDWSLAIDQREWAAGRWRPPEPSAGAGNVLALSQGSGAAAAVALPMSVPPQNAGHAAGLSVPATKDDQTSLMGLTMASDNDEDLIAWSKMLMPESCTPEVGLASFMPSL